MINPDEIRGPLSFVGSLAVSPIEQHQRLTPPQKTLANLSMAASTLGWCLYLSATLGPDFIGPLLRAPLKASGEDWIPLAAGAGVVLIVLLWLLATWKAAQGPRDYGAVLWRLLLGGAVAALLWYRVYPDWGPLAVFLLKGLYIGWLVAHVARFLLAAQLFGGNALRVVNRQRQRNSRPMIAAGGRNFRARWAALAALALAAVWFLW